jgi:hypothetical protein
LSTKKLIFLPPAAKNPFEKGFLDFPKLFIYLNQKLLRMLHGSRGAVFSKRVPLAAGGKIKNLDR